MQLKGRTSRSEVFYISKSFKKTVSLPAARAWRVKDSDVAARGYVLCLTKQKGLLFDKMTNLKPRLVTLTRNGLLIIYCKEDKGFVVDVKDARAMTTKTDHFHTKRQTYRRCALKLKFKYGSVSMIMFNNEIPRWRNAVTNAHDGILRSKLHFIGVNRAPTLSIQKLENAQMKATVLEGAPEDEKLSTSKSPTTKGSKSSVNTCATAEGPSEPQQTNSEVTVDMPEESEPITVIEAPRRNNAQTKKKPSRIVITSDDNSQWETFDPSVCDSSYQWLHKETKKPGRPARKCVSDSTNSGLFTELTDEDESRTESAKSVRCGYHSVSTLRSRLEAKIRGTPSRKSKSAKKRSPTLAKMKEVPTASLTSIEESTPKSRPTIVITPATPSNIERLRRAGRSQSETECSTRTRKEKPAVTSYDDSLLDAPQSERLTNSQRQGEDWRNISLDKYNPNQWWAQPLQV